MKLTPIVTDKKEMEMVITLYKKGVIYDSIYYSGNNPDVISMWTTAFAETVFTSLCFNSSGVYVQDIGLRISQGEACAASDVQSMLRVLVRRIPVVLYFKKTNTSDITYKEEVIKALTMVATDDDDTVKTFMVEVESISEMMEFKADGINHFLIPVDMIQSFL